MQQLAFGVIVFKNSSVEPKKMLLVRANNGSWGFPKGRPTPTDATAQDTALRELAEETGLHEVDLEPDVSLSESYRLPEKYGSVSKTCVYFVGHTDKNDIVIQEGEIQEYEWTTLERARELIQHESRQRILNEIEALIINNI